MNAHPAALIFPLLDGIELGQLVDDIKAHGLLEPITTHEDLILDGRNRFRACELAGVEPRFESWDANGVTPLEYVIAKNLHRRHLTVAQRAAIALDLLPQLEEEARERMAAGGRGEKVSRERETFDVGTSTAKAADLVGVGHTTVETAKAIQERDAEIVNEMRAGDLTVAQAARKAGYQARGTTEPPISDDQPTVYYGKGDKFREATEPLARYLKAWEAKEYLFRHVPPADARKRVAKINELIVGLEAARADLETRTTKPMLSVQG